METISFLLGVAAVITLVIVVVTFMNYVTIKNLIKDIRNLEQVNKAIWRDLDNRESKLLDYSNKLDGDIRQELENLYRHIDSRVDKLEEKTKNQLKDLTSTKSN
jgi:predicted PurR-regulated permease PerM